MVSNLNPSSFTVKYYVFARKHDILQLHPELAKIGQHWLWHILIIRSTIIFRYSFTIKSRFRTPFARRAWRNRGWSAIIRRRTGSTAAADRAITSSLRVI